MVVGLGVLLVAGFLLVVVTIVQRLAGRGGEEAPAGRIEVALPAGCEVAQAWSDSGRLYLRLAGAAADCRRILVVQESSGQVSSEFLLTTAP